MTASITPQQAADAYLAWVSRTAQAQEHGPDGPGMPWDSQRAMMVMLSQYPSLGPVLWARRAAALAGRDLGAFDQEAASGIRTQPPSTLASHYGQLGGQLLQLAEQMLCHQAADAEIARLRALYHEYPMADPVLDQRHAAQDAAGSFTCSL